MTRQGFLYFAHWVLLAGAFMVIWMPEVRAGLLGWSFVALYLVVISIDMVLALKRGELTVPISQLARMKLRSDPIESLATYVGGAAMLLVVYAR